MLKGEGANDLDAWRIAYCTDRIHPWRSRCEEVIMRIVIERLATARISSFGIKKQESRMRAKSCRFVV